MPQVLNPKPSAAVVQMAEHLRISLIDPRWKQQRDIMLAKIRETTKASDDEISRNLVGLAKSRPDVFGALPGLILWLNRLAMNVLVAAAVPNAPDYRRNVEVRFTQRSKHVIDFMRVVICSREEPNLRQIILKIFRPGINFCHCVQSEVS